MAVSFFPGTVPHHQNFNRSLWLKIERHVREELLPEAMRAMVFIGPVFRESDPLYRSTRIPRTFWQVFVAVDPVNPNLLTVHAFAADQYKSNEQGEPLLDDEGEPVPTDMVRDFEPQDYSISLKELTKMTGLDFGYLEQYDVRGDP
jgi:endonuclease G